tara:strand:+ start:766 stop:948 length:183 start_codon:yes stop_codon:yes gene_type:complete
MVKMIEYKIKFKVKTDLLDDIENPKEIVIHASDLKHLFKKLNEHLNVWCLHDEDIISIED